MKAINIFRAIFAATGAVCLLAALYLFNSEFHFKRNAVDVEGVVLRYDGGGLLYAYEYPDGKIHRVKSHTSSSSWTYASGDAIELQVDKREPSRAQIRGFVDQWLGAAMLSFFAVIFGGIGFGMIVFSRRKQNTRALLLSRGRIVRARVSSVALNESISMNGRSPFVVHAEAIIDGQIHQFKSDNLWFDPTPYMETDDVQVYHLPENPKVYYMDISFLPQLAT